MKDPGSSTREGILFILKTRGPKDAATLARRLGVTGMAVRQHLAALEEKGLVTSTEERRPVGRPARIWDLTDAADTRFPDGHRDLAMDLVEAVRDTFGPEGLERLWQERARRQAQQYRSAMPEGGPFSKRIAALARLRRQEGYMAEWRRERDGTFTLVENHCPVCTAARTCEGLCASELELFRQTLGDGTSVQRTEHMLDGARRCAYRIQPD